VGVMTWLFAHLFCDCRGESCSSTNSYVPINEHFFVSEQFLCAVAWHFSFWFFSLLQLPPARRTPSFFIFSFPEIRNLDDMKMEDDNDGSSASPPPVETAEGDGTTKCSVCKKRLGRKSECNVPLPSIYLLLLHTYLVYPFFRNAAAR
jgi:hypothetical protein